MRKFLAAWLILVSLVLPAFADTGVKISALPASGAFSGTELFPVVQGSVTKAGSIGSIWNYILNQDGPGSNLNADLLDGQHGSYYQPAATAINTSNIASQTVNYANSAGTAASATNSGNSNNFGGQPPSYYQPAATAINTSNIGSQHVSYADNAGNQTPPGAISAFAMQACPAGWIATNGSTISRTTYGNLYAAIGTTWGNGDGSTTYTLPDFRGMFLRGWDNGAGADTGRVFASYQADMVGPHTHPSSTPALLQDSNSGGDSHYYGTLGNSGLNSGTETRPKNYAIQYCIKY